MPKTRSFDNLPGSKYLRVARTTSAANWRIQIKQTHLVSQASTILLQRHPKFWSPLLKSLKFSFNFTPSLFLQILKKIHTLPETCLSFFNWAKRVLDFKPDFKVHCELTRILLGSGRPNLGKPFLNSILLDYPAIKIVPLLVQSRKTVEIENVSSVLNSVLEIYCSEDMYSESLEAYRLSIRYGVRLTTASCNSLLNLLADKIELRLVWCCFASMIRNGFVFNNLTWSVIARILCKDGKFERVSKILEMGIHTPSMFDIMIEGYSKRCDFESAFGYLNAKQRKGIDPSFSTCSSILDGACKYHNREVIEKIMYYIVEKGYLPEPIVDFDLLIQKLCDFGKIYAMDYFYKRACDEKVELSHATYGFMLKALLSEGRVNDAVDLYYVLRDNGILIDKSCGEELLRVLCKGNPSAEVTKLLDEIIRGGFCSAATEVSEYIRKLCEERRWRESEGLFNLILDQGLFLDSLSCGSCMKHYCNGRRIDSAILLHDKMEEQKLTLDLGTYNILLSSLFKMKRIEDAMEVFDYMKAYKILSSESFVVMIKGLCHEKELRKAMKLHDEMLELGLKPDKKTYKKLISSFK